MDAYLSGTLTNLNELIETANKTIAANLGGAPADNDDLYKTYQAKASCVQSGKRSCDKDAFDSAFAAYVSNKRACSNIEFQGTGGASAACDVGKIFRSIYATQGGTALTTVKGRLDAMMAQIEDLLVVANEQMRYYNHLSDLNDKYSEAEKTVSGDVDKKTALLKTSNRKQFYEQQQSSLVQPASAFLRYFYWVAVFAWVIVLLYRRKYADYTNAFLTLGFVAFPYVSDILIVWAFKIVSAVYALVPTDAYLGTDTN